MAFRCDEPQDGLADELVCGIEAEHLAIGRVDGGMHAVQRDPDGIAGILEDGPQPGLGLPKGELRLLPLRDVTDEDHQLAQVRLVGHGHFYREFGTILPAEAGFENIPSTLGDLLDVLPDCLWPLQDLDIGHAHGEQFVGGGAEHAAGGLVHFLEPALLIDEPDAVARGSEHDLGVGDTGVERQGRQLLACVVHADAGHADGSTQGIQVEGTLGMDPTDLTVGRNDAVVA